MTADERVRDVRFSGDSLIVDLKDGRTISVPPEWYPRLAAAAPRQREAEQDALAAAIQAEIEADAEWGRSFARSQDTLARLADEALAEYRARRTLPFDPNER